MAAVYTAARAAVGALSVSLKINVTDYADGEIEINHAAMIAGASAAELASLPIYRDFLNKAFESTADAASAFADLGGSMDALGYMYINNRYLGTDGDGYPTFFAEGLDTEDVMSFRVALSASIAA